MHSAFEQLADAPFKEITLGNVEKFRNYSAHGSFSVEPVTCAPDAPSGVLQVDQARYRGRRFVHWHKVEGGVALTDVSLETDLDNNFIVLALDKRSSLDGVWLHLSEPSVGAQPDETEYFLSIATAGGSFFQVPLTASSRRSMLANSTAQHSVRRQAREMPGVVMAAFTQLEDNVSEVIWTSHDQAAVASKDGFLYNVQLHGDSQWRMKKFVTKQSLWLVEALVPEAPSDIILGLAAISLSDELEKLLSVDTAGVIKMWDAESRSLQSQFDLRKHLFPNEDEATPEVVLQQGLIRVALRGSGRFAVIVAITYPVNATLSSSLVLLTGDVHTGTLDPELQLLEQDWKGWVPNDIAVIDRTTACVAWKCGRTKERLISYSIDSEPGSIKHSTLFRELDERLKIEATNRVYSFIPEHLGSHSTSIQTNMLLRRLLDEDRFDWEVIQHVCTGLLNSEEQAAGTRTRSQLAQLIVSSVAEWPDEDWQQRAAELGLMNEFVENDEAEAIHLKYSVLSHLCTERQKRVSSGVRLCPVRAARIEDKLQLFDLIIVRGNRLCLLLPTVSATELIDMETEEFSFPRLKTVVLELVSLGQEFCAQVAPDAFLLPFELGYKSEGLLEVMESQVSDLVRHLATRTAVVENIRQAVQALSVAELEAVFTKLVNMFSAEADRGVFLANLLVETDEASQSIEISGTADNNSVLLQGQAAAHLLAAQTKIVLRDRFTSALSAACALSALAHLGARVVPAARGVQLKSTYVPRGLCNLAAIAFVVWASDTTCTTHTIHETPLRRFEKEPAVVPNMLAVLTGGKRVVAKMAERSDMFERWYRSTNFLTAFWAYMGPAAQEFWGGDDVLRPDLLVGRWAHLLFACLTALRPSLDGELCMFLEMTAQYSVLSRLCSVVELKTSIAARIPVDRNNTDAVWLTPVESRVKMLAATCVLAEAIEIAHANVRTQFDRNESIIAASLQHKLQHVLEDVCEDMLASADRLAELDDACWVENFLVPEEEEMQMSPTELFQSFVESLPLEAAYTITRMMYETKMNPRFKMLHDRVLNEEAAQIPESWAVVAFIQKLHILSLFDRSTTILGALGADPALRCAYDAIQVCELLFPNSHERLDSLWSKAAHFALQVSNRMDEAYTAITNIRDSQRQKETVRTLVTHVCEQGLLHWLITLPYSQPAITIAIESELRDLAAKYDVQTVVRGDRLDYNDCMFAYLCARRQYHKAAKWMYELNRRVEQFGASSPESCEIQASVLDARVRLIAKAISTLELVPSLEQVLKLDTPTNDTSPTTSFAAIRRKRPLFPVDNIVDMRSLRAEFVQVLMARDMLLNQSQVGDTVTDKPQQLQALVESGRFDAAYSFAKAAGLDTTVVIERLACHCCLADEGQCDTAVSQFADIDASYGPRAVSHSHERCWDMLQDILARETAENNFQLHAVAVRTILSHSPVDQSIPAWLTASFAGHALEQKGACTFEGCNGNATKLLRLLIQYGRLAEACEFSLQVLEASNTGDFSNPRRGQVDWLPYNDIDALLVACRSQLNRPAMARQAKLEDAFNRFEQALVAHVKHSLRNEYSGQVARW